MKRVVFLDYLRIFACFLVMLVHASENFYGGPDSTDMAGATSLLLNETDRLWVSLYDGFSRMAVPLFVIMSAYLLVPMKEGENSFSFYKKRFKRILPPMFAFILFYAFLPLLWGKTDIDTAMGDFYRTFINFPTLAGHLWFMYPLIGLYLFIPIISPWLRTCSAKEERLYLGLFLVSTCIPYLNRWVGEVWGQCFWNEYHMLWYFSGYLGYLIMAHYIRVHLNWSRSKRFYVGLACLATGAFLTIYSFYVQAIPGELLVTPELEIGWSFCTINCVILTAGAFLLFTCIEKESTPAYIRECSDFTYGMYLMHIFWLGMWVGIFKEDMNLPTVACIPAIAVATFVSCWLSMKVLTPVWGAKWILGAERKFARS